MIVGRSKKLVKEKNRKIRLSKSFWLIEEIKDILSKFLHLSSGAPVTKQEQAATGDN